MSDICIQRLRDAAGLLALGMALFYGDGEKRAEDGVVGNVQALALMRTQRMRPRS
jgi:hypothetical protein